MGFGRKGNVWSGMKIYIGNRNMSKIEQNWAKKGLSHA